MSTEDFYLIDSMTDREMLQRDAELFLKSIVKPEMLSRGFKVWNITPFISKICDNKEYLPNEEEYYETNINTMRGEFIKEGIWRVYITCSYIGNINNYQPIYMVNDDLFILHDKSIINKDPNLFDNKSAYTIRQITNLHIKLSGMT